MTIQAAIDRVPPAIRTLPLSHVTTYGYLKSNVNAQEIPTFSKCPKGNSANYFFYGCPFYLNPCRKSIYDDVDSHSVAMLLPSELFEKISADMYPFDTGAMRRNMYSGYIDSSENIDEFRVKSEFITDDASKLVSLFFDSIGSHYLTGRPNKTLGKHACDSVNKVRRLHNSRINDVDVRKRAIEVITFQNTSLDKKRLKKSKIVLFMPEDVIEDINISKMEDDVVDRLYKWMDDSHNIEVVKIHGMYGLDPEKESLIIREAAIKWLHENVI